MQSPPESSSIPSAPPKTFWDRLLLRPAGSGRRFRRWRRSLFVAVGLLLLLPVVYVVRVYTQMPSFQRLENPTLSLSSVVYSADREILGSYHLDQHRITVGLEQIPAHVQQALLAREDVRFYSHAGVDPIAFLSAVFSQLSGNPRGGSSITQQLARNLYDQEVGRDRNVERKIREAIVAFFLERRFTKAEILEGYFNTVPWGGTVYGIQAAAKRYFNKEVKDLTLTEGAMLIAMLKGPSLYDPVRNVAGTTLQRNVVLDQMVRYGYLPEATADSAKKAPLGTTRVYNQEHNAGLATYFREQLRPWITEWCKKNGYDLYADGLRIYTTLNARMQRYAEEAVHEHLREFQPVFEREVRGREPWIRNDTITDDAIRRSARYNMMRGAGASREDILKTFRTDKRAMRVFSWTDPRGYIDTTMTPRDSVRYYARFLQPGMMVMDPATGHILAWVGGIDQEYFQYDHVQLGKRQVGSTFKPFVYTAAFDNGFSPCHELLNVPVEVHVGEREDGSMEVWRPSNSDGSIGGCMTLRRALAMSVNIVTARVMKDIGPRVVREYAYRMGITTKLDAVYSLALGTVDLSVFEMTSAYATFANGGVWNEPIFVTRIEDKFGNVLEQFKGKSREALSPETAYLMVDMLRGVVNSGTAFGLKVNYGLDANIDIGGKTGTTQDHSDGWFMGITPYLTAGIWVGGDDRRVRFPTLAYGQGGKMAMPIFGKFLKKVYDDKELSIPRTFFERPRNLRVEIDCAVYRRTHPGECQPEGSVSDDDPRSMKFD